MIAPGIRFVIIRAPAPPDAQGKGMLNHILAVTSYTVIAVAVAVALPLGQGASALVAFLAGTVVFLGGLQCHLFYILFGARQRDDRHGNGLRDRLEMLVRELRGQQLDLESLKALGSESSAAKADTVAEMHVLQGLLGQLLVKKKKTKGQAAKSPTAAPIGPADGLAPGPGANGLGAGDATAPVANDALVPPDDAEIFRITRQALAENRVDLYMQPIVSLPQRKVRYYECFSRIRDESGGMVEPETFLPSAERAGLVSALDNLLLFRCVQLIRDFKRHNKSVGFFLNISSHTLNDSDFFPQFIDFMFHNQELADDLIFEFSQAGLAEHGVEVEQNLERLARLGFQFSMDKVRSLNFEFPALAARHIKFIKIEADVLLAGNDNPEGQQEATRIKKDMRRYDIDLIVEKIEGEDRVIDLLDFDIDFGQGYLFGEPRPSRDGSRQKSRSGRSLPQDRSDSGQNQDSAKTKIN